MTRADRQALLRAARLLEGNAKLIWQSNVNHCPGTRFHGKMTDLGAIEDHAALTKAADELRAIAGRKG